ncbi:hypothetical protein [Nibrella saemangeumensis]
MMNIIRVLLFYPFFVLLFQNVTAQTTTRNSVNVGLSYMHFRNDNFKGISYYNEYNRRLNDSFTLSPSMQVGFATGKIAFGYVRSTVATIAMDANVFFSPIRAGGSKLRFGGGPSLRFFSDSRSEGYIVFRNYDDLNIKQGLFPYVLSPIIYTRPNNYLTIGYSVVAEAEFNLSTRWLIGIKATYQSYRIPWGAVRKELIYSVGINLGYRF